MMTIVKKILFPFLLFMGIIYSNPLHAQEAIPKNRWMVGANLGIKLYLDCGGNCYDRRSVASMQSKNAFVHYRLFQGFGLTASVDHFRIQNYTTGVLWNPNYNSLTPSTQLDAKYNMFYASIGPRFLFRLGQGDLGIETRIGIGFNAMRLDALNVVGDAYAIKYKSILSSLRMLQLSYVYWPKPQFGVNISVASTWTDDDTVDPVTVSIKAAGIKTPIEEIYPDISPAVLNQLSPKTTGTHIVYLALGFTYRFGPFKNSVIK